MAEKRSLVGWEPVARGSTPLTLVSARGGSVLAARLSVSRPRQILPGATYLVTRRCAQRQFLLRPSRTTNQILLYCLARATELYPVTLHAFCFLSNHYHLVLTDPDARLPEFMRYLNEMIARALNASMGRWENLWAPGSYSAVRLAEPSDVVDKAAYVLANPVAAGLVRRAHDWPGVIGGLADREPGQHAGRPAIFFRTDGPLPETCEVSLDPPAGFDTWDGFASQVSAELERREHDARMEMQRTGRPFLGIAGVKAQRPADRPGTLEPRRTMSPRVAAMDTWKRIDAIERLRRFLQAYREAWACLKARLPNVVFPPGTYLLQVRHGVAVATAAT
jgi:REP element-mobilizing transposase RayT